MGRRTFLNPSSIIDMVGEKEITETIRGKGLFARKGSFDQKTFVSIRGTYLLVGKFKRSIGPISNRTSAPDKIMCQMHNGTRDICSRHLKENLEITP